MSAAALPSDVRRYIASLAVSRFGTGLTLPYTLILLHEVRGIALPTVGLLLAVPGIVGLAAVPASGVLVDRWGPAAVLRGCLLAQALGSAGLAAAHTPAQAVPALLLSGLGLGPSFPAGNALLSALVTRPDQVTRAFGVQFTVINAAIGTGGVVAASVVDVHRPETFVVLFATSAFAALLQAAVLPSAGPPVHADADAPQGSYREVWADQVFRRMCLVSLLFALTGYAALDAGVPAFARVEGHVSPSAIGLVFTVNTALIVSLQLPALRLVRSWRRTQALVVAAGLWALAWAVLGLVPVLGEGLRTPAVLVFGAVFGLGEVFMAPALQPLVNALASDRLRGRYNALSSAAFSVAFVVSPALSGALIGLGYGGAWLVALVLGCLVSVSVTLALRSRLTADQEGAPALAAPVLAS
ncbi:MAG: MFS transporter [Mycobacteriales bacterium]